MGSINILKKQIYPNFEKREDAREGWNEKNR